MFLKRKSFLNLFGGIGSFPRKNIFKIMEPSALPSTYREYYEDSYRFESTAKVLKVQHNEGGEVSVILDKTIFHPQGGGQPNDEGIIWNENGRFLVSHLIINGETILHKGKFEEEGKEFVEESDVQLQVDAEKRKIFARVHSAGHLIDIAMLRIG